RPKVRTAGWQRRLFAIASRPRAGTREPIEQIGQAGLHVAVHDTCVIAGSVLLARFVELFLHPVHQVRRRHDSHEPAEAENPASSGNRESAGARGRRSRPRNGKAPTSLPVAARSLVSLFPSKDESVGTGTAQGAQLSERL